MVSIVRKDMFEPSPLPYNRILFLLRLHLLPRTQWICPNDANWRVTDNRTSILLRIHREITTTNRHAQLYSWVCVSQSQMRRHARNNSLRLKKIVSRNFVGRHFFYLFTYLFICLVYLNTTICHFAKANHILGMGFSQYLGSYILGF